MLETIRAICPYPTVQADGSLRDGRGLTQPKYCRKCDHKSCQSLGRKATGKVVSHHICEEGFSVFVVNLPSGTILVNGVIDQLLNQSLPPHLKKQYRSHKVGINQIENWAKIICDLEEEVPNEINRKVGEAISGYHDVRTAANLISRNAESLISDLPGPNDDSKIESAPPKLKALFKAVRLLNSRLTAMNIIANPESASYGQKRPAPIHRIFTKIARVFEEIAAENRVIIKIMGTSRKAPRLYDSFELVPLTLIDNAVKYSMKGQTVDISINDTPDGVDVSVISYGPTVPEGLESKIFERGFRTDEAKEYSADGSGLGLYIASIVAMANGFKISYVRKSENQIEGKCIGKNSFDFFVN